MHCRGRDDAIGLQCAVFGSEPRADLGSKTGHLGLSPSHEVTWAGKVSTFPAFCGRARPDMDDPMSPAAAVDEMMEESSEQHLVLAPWDYVMQNLQCRLGNPRNRCYANAPFRLWAWAGNFMEGPGLWNKTAAAVQAMTEDDVVQITHLHTLRALWEMFDDSVQDDASHFITEMIDLAETKNVITHYYQVDYHQQVQWKKAFPVHFLFLNNTASQEFEVLINDKANTAEGQVFDGEGLWVAQIGRYTQVDGEWTKHHQPLHIPSIFNLPVTKDGNATTTEQYSLIGLLCHSGTAHKSGHFFAVFIYRGLYWLVDNDEPYPRPIPRLQEALKMQIVQVWAAPSKKLLPVDLPCDFQTKTISHTPPDQGDTKRPCQEGLNFTFANVTNLAQRSQTMVAGTKQDTDLCC